jgi:hypothetical protein
LPALLLREGPQYGVGLPCHRVVSGGVQQWAMDSPALLGEVFPVYLEQSPGVHGVSSVVPVAYAVYVGRPQVSLGVAQHMVHAVCAVPRQEVDRPRPSLGVARHTVYAVPSPLHPVLSYPTIPFHPLHFQVASRPVSPGMAILASHGTVLPGVSSQVSHGADALAKGP